jgi:hypothetical protein
MISPHFELTGHEAKGLLYGLLEVNKQQLRENPGMPSIRELIRQGKVVYNESDPGEHWQTYRELVEAVNRDGVAYGDCEDLGPAVAAEDQVRYGIESLPYAYAPREGLYHVVTAIPTSAPATFGGRGWPRAMGAPAVPGYTFIDPSAAAGMGMKHLGVRAKFGKLTVPGSSYGAIARGGASSSIFSSFLEGIGLPMSGLGADEVARQAGHFVGQGAGKLAGGYLENLDLGPISDLLGGSGKGGSGKGKKKSAPEDEEFGALGGSSYGRMLESAIEAGVNEALEGHRWGVISP